MRRTLPLLFALALMLLPTPAAQARTPTFRDLLRECGQTGQVSNPGAWTRAQYEQAIAHVPADVAEYTRCVSILQRAELARAAAGGGGTAGGGGSTGGTIPPVGGGGGGGGGPQSPAELAALQRARQGPFVSPTAHRGPLAPLLHLSPASQRHALPASLAALLVLLGVGTVLASTPSLLRRVRLRGQP